MLLATACTLALATGPAEGRRGGDHDRAMSSRQRGDVLPLRQILIGHPAIANARILDARMNDDGRRIVYEVKVLDESGQVRLLRFDARTGALLDSR